MKNAAQHAREFKKLLKKIRREKASPLPDIDDPMQALLRGVLTDYISEQRAASAAARLRASIVDINELRVTPIAEIVEMIGADVPLCRRAAEDIVRALNTVFNKLHHLDLTYLKKVSRRTAESFMNNLDGLNVHARASVILRCLKGHAIPADVTMCEILRRESCVEPDASVEVIQKFLATQVRESQAASFYAQFKRYAANHVPRKMALTPSKAIPLPQPEPSPAPEPSAPPAAPPARSASGKSVELPRPARSAAAARSSRSAKRTQRGKPAKPARAKSAKSKSARRNRNPARKPRTKSHRPKRSVRGSSGKRRRR